VSRYSAGFNKVFAPRRKGVRFKRDKIETCPLCGAKFPDGVPHEVECPERAVQSVVEVVADEVVIANGAADLESLKAHFDFNRTRA
jgi:hypothetical protein